MRKLKLDLDCLVVDSFDTKPVRAGGRTVFGQEMIAESDTCGGGSCDGTCYTDCWGLSCPACGETALAFCTQGCGSNTCRYCV
jgi:hypothetical protein